MMKQPHIFRWCVFRRSLGITLMEMLIVLSLMVMALAGLQYLVERNLRSSAATQNYAYCLSMAQNELEWWAAAGERERAELTPGEHPLYNSTAKSLEPPFEGKLIVSNAGENCKKLEVRITKNNSGTPLSVTLVTILPVWRNGQ
jgi:Tfp pilus assembly protein PilV